MTDPKPVASASSISPFQRLKHRLTPTFSRIGSFDGEEDANNKASDDSEENDWDEEPPLSPLSLIGYKKGTKRRLLTKELANDLRQHIPSVLQISHTWKLRYSMEQDGTSLNTLYDKCKPEIGENTRRRRGYFLVIMDSHGDRFGAYLNEYLRAQDGRHYYGNGDCFLWKTERVRVKKYTSSDGKEKVTVDDNGSYGSQFRLKVFRYTHINDFIIYSNHNFISIGSGDGKFGLWIDSSFLHGATDPVDTFGNEQLSRDEKFTILGLEVWKVE